MIAEARRALDIAKENLKRAERRWMCEQSAKSKRALNTARYRFDHATDTFNQILVSR